MNAVRSRHGDLVEHGPEETSKIEDDEERAADQAGGYDDKLADQNNIQLRLVSRLLPVVDPVDCQCHGQHGEHGAGDREVTRVDRVTHAIDHSKRHLSTVAYLGI